MPKVILVATYFERQYQLNKTLQSISTLHNDFEVVIVDDGSKDDIILPELSFKVTVLKTSNKTWSNPEPAYNTGIAHALSLNADVIILQNAECYHVGDVISYASRLTPENYISFACYSINQETTFKDHNIREIIESHNYGAVVNGENSWYNHPQHRPVAYDFCSAITADNIRKLNGYDERFSEGCSYGDDYLISRVKMLGLNIEIPTDPFVVHQWHYNIAGNPDHEALCKRNSDLLIKLNAENNYRAVHLITPDL